MRTPRVLHLLNRQLKTKLNIEIVTCMQNINSIIRFAHLDTKEEEVETIPAIPANGTRAGINIVALVQTSGNGTRPGTQSAPQSPPMARGDTMPSGEGGEGEIRPMTLAPIQDGAGSYQTNEAMTALTSGGGEESGGGTTPPPDKAPVIDFSGGNTVQKKDAAGQPIEGQYDVPDGVPVGTFTYITASAPADSGYIITKYTWSNGGDVSAYLSTNANQAPPKTQIVEKNVQKGNEAYRFVVDSKARDYSLSIDVDYQVGNQTAKGHSTLTFKSVRPETAYLEKVTNPQPGQRNVEPHVAQYYDVAGIAGMGMEAHTKAHAKFGGEFMVIQIADVQRTYKDANGVVKTMAGNNKIDDGAAGLNIGMKIVNGHHSWTLEAGEEGVSQSNYVEDPVYVPSPNPNTDKELTVGTLAQAGPPPVVAKPEKFRTYLMYRPTNGVWVALSSLSWGWGIQLANQNGNWQEQPGTSQNPNVTTTDPIAPGDDDFWPTWTGATSDLAWQ